jgi:hypothetical protein
VGRGARLHTSKELVHVIRPIPILKDEDPVNKISKSLLQLSLYYGEYNSIIIKRDKISIGSNN